MIRVFKLIGGEFDGDLVTIPAMNRLPPEEIMTVVEVGVCEVDLAVAQVILGSDQIFELLGGVRAPDPVEELDVTGPVFISYGPCDQIVRSTEVQ